MPPKVCSDPTEGRDGPIPSQQINTVQPASAHSIWLKGEDERFSSGTLWFPRRKATHVLPPGHEGMAGQEHKRYSQKGNWTHWPASQMDKQTGDEGRTMRILAPGLQKVPSEGCQNGSAVTGTRCLAKQPEFDALNSHGRRNWLWQLVLWSPNAQAHMGVHKHTLNNFVLFGFFK